MKRKIESILIWLMIALLTMYTTGCKKILDVPVYSQLAPGNFLNTGKGITATLAFAYSRSAMMNGNETYRAIGSELFSTDLYYQTDGGDNALAKILMNFSWSSSDVNTFVYDIWTPMWQAILNANLVLENLNSVKDITEEEKMELDGEARFVRAYAYYKLWNLFGPVPLRQNTQQPEALARASREEFSNFMESELATCISELHDPGKELNYGRANKGAARALLTKWYLNTYQWEKCVEISGEMMALGHYQLVSDYNQMFEVDNERNTEFIWVQPALTNQNDAHNSFLAPVLPPGFQKTADYQYPFTFQAWSNFASQFRLRDAFVNSFSLDDDRAKRILKKYINTNGDTIDLMKVSKDNARGIKFPPDPNASGNLHGNDFPFLRYADIILSRAEALNNLHGPNQESIDLLNKIRHRAGIEGSLSLEDFSAKEELSDLILEERAHEFWYEGKRRRDLIRMGKFIEFAKNRGVNNATARDTLFPLSQSALDANLKLTPYPVD